MLSEDKYFQDLSEAELWQRYCGFLDLSIDDFMNIQRELLMDQIDRVADSILGKKIMGNRKPKSVEEFRRMVPLTTYDDYEPYLSERRDDALATEPLFWCHSTGRGGQFKWVPHSPETVEIAVKRYVSTMILSTAKKKGDVNIAPGLRFLVIFAPPPYTSGYIISTLAEHFSLRLIPPAEQIATLGIQTAIIKGFEIALKDGVDIIAAISSVLVKMGEAMSQHARGMKLSLSMLHPKVIMRLLHALLRSKIAKRTILPQDIWRAKGIIVGGLDTAIYKDDVTHYWGNLPFEYYGGTEGLVYALNSWTKKGLIFIPDLVFFEFLPYEEVSKLQKDKDYQPTTVLLNEVQEGKLYEVIITQLYGMPLLRYRLGDIVKVISKRDEEAGIDLPHVVFQRRVGELIELAGMARLDEKTLWKAINNTGVKYADWVARKEYDQNQAYLHIYIELNEEVEISRLESTIDEQLKIVDTDYKDVDSYLGLQPVRVTRLISGTFQHYTEDRVKEGASIAHMKPIHINPDEAIIKQLISFQ
jgi:hypothetical protein